MSMDGNNRTVIIEVDTYYNAVVSLTLDYQAQVLYWIFGNNSNSSLSIKRSNTDGTNQQTILQLQNVHYYYYYLYHYPSGLTMYNDTLLFSLSWTREVYKLRTNGENFTLFINSSMPVFCRNQRYQFPKVTNQPSGQLQLFACIKCRLYILVII